MKNTKKKGINIYIILGLMLIASALAFAFYNMWDENRAAKQVDSVASKLRDLVAKAEYQDSDNPDEKEYPDFELNIDMAMPRLIIDDYSYVGLLEIPNLNLELPVLDSWDYDKLKIAPCTYKGTPYKDNFIILAHNYNSHFGSLDKLKIDNKITFTDMDGNEFKYKVVEMEILKDTQVEDMETGDWDLTLFTCNLSGKLRITVRCQKLD